MYDSDRATLVDANVNDWEDEGIHNMYEEQRIGSIVLII